MLSTHRKSSRQGAPVQLAEEVRSLREQLARTQRRATVGTMAAMVAHEFNNILTPMSNYARLAADGDEEMRDKAIRHTLEGSARAAEICRALLDITKNECQTPQRVSLLDLLDETISAMGRDFSKDGIRLVRKIPARLKVTTKPSELKQVLLNLLLNARVAVMEKGGDKNISISAEQSGDAIVLRVADTGAGIAPEIKKHIFEPFFTTHDKNGSGLGLAVCKQIIKSMKGRLTVRSQVGKGTVFTVSLPVKTAAAKSRRISHKQPIARSA